MKVTVAVKGRFHAFYLAHELQKHGYLQKLITTYPVFETLKYGVEKNLIKSLIIHEIIDRAWRKLPDKIKFSYNAQFLLHEIFDIYASHYIPKNTDIFVGWSSFSLHGLRRAKALGAKIVLERGSSHISYQTDILKQEYAELGLRGEYAHPRIVAKELEEYAEADRIAIPSTYVKETFLQYGVAEAKLIQVPYGVNLERFYPIPKADAAFRVIHCGNLSIRKGVHYLLQAFAELRLPEAELWLIGSLPEEIKPFLRQWASPAIIHQGPFPERELYQYYSQGSVFCLASIEEGLAMVQAQAMACGLPVICTTNTGGADLVRNGVDGFVVPIRDVDALKEKILFFYNNRDACKTMGESARRRVSRGFAWSDYGDKMIQAYHHLLGTRPPNGKD